MVSGVINSSNAHTPRDTSPRANITGSAEDTQDMTFEDLGVCASIVEALKEHGITHPFPIQALTLPVALKRKDIIGQAKTGTGKTLGFGIPMIENCVGPGEEGWDDLPEKVAGKPQGLVVLPTRELALQVAVELRNAAAHRALRIVDIYGGIAYEPQQKALARGAEIVVGTPGRILDLMKRHILNVSYVSTVVLDEADEMLDLGFLEDVEAILSKVPARRHTMLFSATMPGPVIAMARRYMITPTHIRAQDPDDDTVTSRSIRQVVYRTHNMNREEVLARILQADGRGRTIIFTRTKRSAQNLANGLERRGFATGSLHGDLGQSAREQALRAFRKGKIDVLVATDVAARGIDVDDVTHVINYQCPDDEKIYVHRIGRTGRAGNKGTAVTFVDWEDMTRWSMINNQLNLGISEPVETYHTSEHLYTDLGIPEGVTGELPSSQRTLAGIDAEEMENLGETGRKSRARGSRSKRSARTGQSRKSGRARKNTQKHQETTKTTGTAGRIRRKLGEPRQEQGTQAGKKTASSSTRRRRRLVSGLND
ncbi:DEAD/DEAH box helicase [Actinotignum urinale]|uniref:DEAD/DEAH box helicase n=1 Tax=Actinotignum urinale TaxID=190146 RepID=UPI002A8409BC|nr:DEAD/DEAH box helicase [Actinotignum urinale]MDY5151085.1 DEAD/DEAH box helicase [Actinotignum urinale]